MLITRPATEADAPAIRALIDENVASGALLPRTEDFISLNHEHYLVVTENDTVLGCIHLEEYAPSIAEVRSVAVSSAARGRGVGDALMAAVERLARQRQVTTIFAVTNNLKFFADRGFEERAIPELDRERSAVSRYKGVYAKDVWVDEGARGGGDGVGGGGGGGGLGAAAEDR